MKKNYFAVIAFALFATTLQSCELVEGIFKAGMWWAFILVALVIGLIFWLLRGRRG